MLKSFALKPDRPWLFVSESKSDLPSHSAGLATVNKLLPGWTWGRLELRVCPLWAWLPRFFPLAPFSSSLPTSFFNLVCSFPFFGSSGLPGSCCHGFCLIDFLACSERSYSCLLPSYLPSHSIFSTAPNTVNIEEEGLFLRDLTTAPGKNYAWIYNMG